MANLPPGYHYWKIDDYPANIRRIVHSTNVNPVYPEPITAEAYAEIRRLVTLPQSPWVTEDLGIWLMSERHVYPFFLPLPLQKEALAVAIKNIQAFHTAVGEFPLTLNSLRSESLPVICMPSISFASWLRKPVVACAWISDIS